MISFTDNAIAQLKPYLSQEQASYVRLSLEKTGCSGWSYKLDIAKAKNPDDQIFPVADFELLVASKYLEKLSGTTVDYVKQGFNSEFKFINPNVQAECGCGVSVNFDDNN